MDIHTLLVTGGSRGIGAQIVRHFTALGYKTAFFYHSDHEAAKALAHQTGALAIQADVADSAAVKRGYAQARQALGAVDTLICNAGISSFGLLQEVSDAQWHRVMSTNLDGAFYTVREALPAMISASYGRILLISSIWGISGASMEVAYSTSKAALIGMTKALAKEVGPSGITVNCIAPGVIDTDMNKNLSPEILAELADQTPVCRLGTPDDIARAAAFLCLETSSFVTGQILTVDGGFL